MDPEKFLNMGTSERRVLIFKIQVFDGEIFNADNKIQENIS